MKTFFLTACEASGDRLGAALIRALQEKIPDARFVGVAGPLMREAGCEALIPQEDLAIMGFWEVLKNLPLLLKARKQVFTEALQKKPDAYIGIDAPDFNLWVETKLKAKNIKTIHVNSPTIWAWREGRIQKIKKAVDLMLVLFPFETKIYEAHHIPVAYIGHPLADEIPLEHSQVLPEKKQKILALMPGSRASEIKHLAPLFLQAAKLCQEKIPHLKILVPMINKKRAEQFDAYLQSGLLRFARNDISVSIGNAHEVLKQADAVLIASGTATLEALLCNTPMVVAYKADALSFWIAKKLVKIPHVSLPNILADKEIVPEFLQERASAENLSRACLEILSEKTPSQIEHFSELHRALQQNAAKKAAEAILSVLD